MLSVPKDSAQEISLLQNETSERLSESINALHTLNGFSAQKFKKTKANLTVCVKMLKDCKANLHSVLNKLR